MANSRQSVTIFSPSSKRPTKRTRSSITEHSFQGITPSPRGGSVTHVSGTNCHPCVRPLTLPQALMILRTVEQVRRVFLVVAGFTLLLAGVVMLVTPGPGILTIFLGLGLLAAEFVWARRLMDRIKRQGGKWKDAVMGQPKE